jgi:hypothetical protein
VQLVNDKECTAENEGVVETEWKRLFNGGPTMVIPVYPSYYRCENGSWNPKEASVTCDTTGVTVGAICGKVGRPQESPETGDVLFFIYEGDGNWKRLYVNEEAPKKCTADNAGSVEEFTFGNEQSNVKLHYECDYDEYLVPPGRWSYLSKEEYEEMKRSSSEF